MAKVDSLNNKYQILNKASDAQGKILILSIAISVLNYCFPTALAITIPSVVVLVAYFLCSIFTKVYSNILGNKRIINAVENGFGKDIDSAVVTKEYYNNNLDDGLDKFNLNIFESVFFTKHIFDKQVIKSYLLYGFALFAALMVLVFGNLNISVLALEIIVGCDILSDLIRSIYFDVKIKALYESFDRVYTSKTYLQSRHYLLALGIEYERLKAFYGLCLDTKIFDAMNAELSRKWEDYCNISVYTN